MILHNADSIEINFERCLNKRHFQADCDHCIKVCPTNAIALVKREIVLTKESCAGCGVCLKECPTEVFTSKKWDERSIFEAVSETDSKKIEIFCNLHDKADIGEKKVGSIQLSTCLGAVSQGLWFELGMKHQVGIRLDKCQDCALNSVVRRIKQAVEYANEWLMSCGYEPGIVCLENVGSPTKRKVRPVINAGDKRISRRNFFQSLFQTSSAQSSDSVKEQFPKQGWDKAAKFPKHLPSWMKHLADVYPDKTSSENSRIAYWPSIKVNNDCCACNTCIDYCPTGALTSEYFSDYYRLLFVPGKCIDCRICEQTCPQQAIDRLRETNTSPFVQQEVYNNEVVRCERCRKPAVVDKNNLCYWCAEEPSIKNVLADAKRAFLS